METIWFASAAALLILLILPMGIGVARKRARSIARSRALIEAKSLKARPHIPPPTIVQPQWFFRGNDGEAYGPLTRVQLARLFDLNVLSGSTLVLAEDGKRWRPMSDVFVLPVHRRSKSWRLGNWRVGNSSRYRSYYSHSQYWELRLQSDDARDVSEARTH